MNTTSSNIRFDLKLIASWIEPGSRVLDLGCGEGDLLSYLRDHLHVQGTGIDQDEDNVSICIRKKLSVIQGDINREVMDYQENSFDYVVLSRTLQQVYHPSDLLQTLVRIGKRVVVSFPNFSHITCRFQLFFKGTAPVTPQLPYGWYDTPNIRVITLKDFRRYAAKMGLEILKEAGVRIDPKDGTGKEIAVLKNYLASYGIYLIEKKKGWKA